MLLNILIIANLALHLDWQLPSMLLYLYDCFFVDGLVGSQNKHIQFTGQEEDFVKVTAEGQFQCALCGSYKSARKFNTIRHIGLKHGAGSNEIWQCHICQKFYKNKLSLEGHQRIEHNIYKDSSL